MTMGGDEIRPADSPGLAAGDITIGDIPDAVFATDLENRVTHWADSAAALFGFSAAEAIGRPFGELMPFEMRREDERMFLTAIRAGRIWRGQGTVRLRDGRALWIESTVKPRLVNGRIVGSVSVSRDVTETIEAELRLSQEKQFVNGVLNVAGSLVLVLDPDGTVIRFNAACEKLSGYRAEEVIGRPMWDLLIPPDELDGVAEAFTQLRAGDFPNSYENHWLNRAGTRRLISWSNTCLTNEDGTVSHVIATGTDVTDHHRADSALRDVAAVGQILASHGPSDSSLDAVLGVLADSMGYRNLVLLIAQGDRLRIGASRGYESLPASLPIGAGIVGRTYRTGEAAWVKDVRDDPDYFLASPEVRSEIAVPLRAHGQVIGVLDIGAAPDSPLTQDDLRLALAVGEQVTSALLLGREQQALAERARLLANLSDFARATDAVLETDRLALVLMDALTGIFPGDVMTLTLIDRATGRYHLRAARGVSDEVLGLEVRPGDGPAGRAIEARAFVGPVKLTRADYLSALHDLIPFDELHSVAVPLIHDDLVLGAISVGRTSVERSFSDVECEVMLLLGSQAALALANAHLHEEVSELAIHDGLTGLYNRRQFDESLNLIFARWQRLGGGSLAAIMFDLDHFGRFNQEHGHQAGDAVLRAFAGLMRERLRSSDLVARYGGEEFVVVLEECSLAGAIRVAEEIRIGLEKRLIDGPDGQQLRAAVSAGCAVLDPAEPTKEALLRNADTALFKAKREGRNRVVATG
jgi:diguanylate cyclase (GGDEF)-like protein/PAS domain S-box-containing protein